MLAPKTALLLILLAAPGWHWLVGIRQRNAAVAQAQAAGQRGTWSAAAASWHAAAGPRPGPDVLLNLAYAQLKAGQTAAARRSYGQLLTPATPAAIGSIARQQLARLAATQRSFVPALGLLREALRLDPANAVARRNYERLRAYLDGQNANNATPPPASPEPDPAEKQRPKPAPAAGGPSPAPAPKPAAGPTAGPPHPQPEGTGPAGPPALRPPAPTPTRPGSGPRGPVPTGSGGGGQRGLTFDSNNGPNASDGRSSRPGTDAATPANIQLQTQRQRLQALNLTAAQARQILETLRAQEQQYLQQVRRPATAPEAINPKLPTW